MSIKFNSIPTKTLAESITSSATSFRLNNITGWDGDDLVAGDFGTTGYGVFRNATNTAVEFFEFDPSTIASSSITITRRGLYHNAEDLTTEVSANKLSWTKGDTYVDLGTDTPQMLQWMKEYIDTASIAGAVPATDVVQGIALLSTTAATPSAPVVVGDNDPRVPTQDEKDALAGDGGTPSSSNPYMTRTRTMTAGATINGATLPVPVYQNKTDNEFYACDANDTSAMKFIGFAISNGTDGNDVEVQFTGVVHGFSGLNEGEKYYVQDTAGTIGTSIGTYEVLVGVAISTTELLIQKGKRYAAGSADLSAVTATGSEAVTCGFRPSRIKLVARGARGNASIVTTVSHMDMAWVNGTVYAASLCADSSNNEIVTTNARFYSNGAGSAYLTFTITSVTDTGFTITYTESGSFELTDSFYMWEAEGEL